MQEHLSRWIEALDDQVQKKAHAESSLFYAAVSALTRAFVLLDYDLLLSLTDTDSKD